MTIKQWLQQATKKLAHIDISSARLDSLIMLEEVLGLDRTHIVANDDNLLAPHQHKQLDLMLQKRQQHIPLAYITGVREFYGLDFRVDESVLIPRPETEFMVEYLVEYAPDDSSVLELGTGSGAVAVALRHHRPDLVITATDISDLALLVAKDNAQHHGVDIRFIKSDLFAQIERTFDVIAANLPYVPTEARRQPEIAYEPDISLYSGTDGLDHYRRFFSQLPKHAHKHSQIVIEFSPTQFWQVRNLAFEHNLHTTPLTEYIYLCTFIN